MEKDSTGTEGKKGERREAMIEERKTTRHRRKGRGGGGPPPPPPPRQNKGLNRKFARDNETSRAFLLLNFTRYAVIHSVPLWCLNLCANSSIQTYI